MTVIFRLSIVIFILLSSCSLRSKVVDVQKEPVIEKIIEQKIAMTDINMVVKSEEKQYHDQVGYASWYGGRDGLHKKKTASGSRFDKNALTAAHKTLPMHSIVKVTNLENNKSVIVTINDRGPFIKNRIIDLSEKAAKLLNMKQKGFAKVKIEHEKPRSKK